MWKRALVFDEEEGIRSLLISILEMKKYEVLAFPKPHLWSLYLDSNCPCPEDYACGDLFIINNHMMNMTGLEFIERQTRYNCKVIPENKALISTTYTDAEIKQAKKLGCHLFEKLSFIDKIDSWLDECEKRIDPNRRLFNLNLK